MPLVLEDLGNTSVITSIGFLSNSLGIRVDTTIRRQAQDFFPDIRAVDFHVVCEVAGLERGTVSMVSFVADFECDNDGRSSVNCPPGPVLLRAQFQYNCTTGMMYDTFFFEGDVLTENPVASFSTVPERRCGLCVDPVLSGVTSDPETHCFRKFNT